MNVLNNVSLIVADTLLYSRELLLYRDFVLPERETLVLKEITKSTDILKFYFI